MLRFIQGSLKSSTRAISETKECIYHIVKDAIDFIFGRDSVDAETKGMLHDYDHRLLHSSGLSRDPDGTQV